MQLKDSFWRDQSNLQPNAASLSQWLKAIGFQWPPFDLVDAAQEEELEGYFVEPPCFREMLERHHTVLYATLGGGKTASRVVLECLCARGDPQVAGILSVTCDDFSRVMAQAEGDPKKVKAEMLAGEVLRGGADAIFDYLIEYPGQLANVEIYYRRWLARSLEPWDERIVRALQGTEIAEEKFYKAVAKNRVEALLDRVVEDFRPRVEVVASLFREMGRGEGLEGWTAGETLTALSELAIQLGFEGVFVLLDNVDGLDETHTPEGCAALVRPLFTTVSVLSVPQLWLKLFLPVDVRPRLANTKGIQSGRVRELVVKWTGEQLQEALKERLRAASGDQIESLAAVSEERLKDRIDRELVQYAETPRDLCLLGQGVFRAHNRLSKSGYITVQALESVLESKKKERVQHRQESLRRGLKRAGIAFAAFFALTSLLTWGFFLWPKATPIQNVSGTDLFVFAGHPRCLAIGADREISLTARNDGAAEVTGLRATLVFTPALCVAFPDTNVATFEPLSEGVADTETITVVPQEGRWSGHFDLQIAADGGVKGTVTGGNVTLLPVPAFLVEHFLVQPFLGILGSILAVFRKTISDLVVKVLRL